MFSYLKAMYHQSKIQAELKVQIHEQTTVNAICHHPESIEIIAVCSTDAYYRKRALLQIVGGDKLIIPFC